MKTLIAEELSAIDNYKLLIGSVIPRPIAFVTTLSENGVLNGAPFSFFNVISAAPPLLGVSIQRVKGKQKDTAKHAIERGGFVVHIVDNENVEKINQTSATLPEDESEITASGLTPVESTSISVPGIKESKIRMECRLEKVIQFGEDNENESCDLLVGRILKYHIDDRIYDDGKIDPRGLQAVSRLAGNDYAEIGDIFTIKRPK